jgi:hypothetical protein
MPKNEKKPVKKAAPLVGKSADKAAVKSDAKKALAKPTKGAKPLVKTLVNAVSKVLGKGAAKAAPKTVSKASGKASADKPKTGKSASEMTEDVKIPAPKREAKKESKKAKKAKKTKDDELDLGDDLVGDDDMGAEDIPDLAEFDENEVEETEDLDLDDSEADAAPKVASGDEEVVLTDAEGRRYCRVRDCDQISVVEGYCRFHYLQLWKKIQIRRKILTDGKLQRYVEELTARYPDKFLEMIRKDLRAEKDFLAAIAELEIDESAIDNDFEDEAQNFIDEVRGMSETSGMGDEQEEF